MKEQFEQMSLDELRKVLRDGLTVLHDKLNLTNGYGNFSHITGQIDTDWPDVYIINTGSVYGNGDIDSTDIFKL